MHALPVSLSLCVSVSLSLSRALSLARSVSLSLCLYLSVSLCHSLTHKNSPSQVKETIVSNESSEIVKMLNKVLLAESLRV